MIKKHKVSVLDSQKIINLVNNKKIENRALEKLEKYYLGTNSSKNTVAVSLGRKLIKSVMGFMFKENAITYQYPEDIDKGYEQIIRKIFDNNDEENHNLSLALDQAKYGCAFELLYIDPESKEIRFSKMGASQIIPVYKNTIDSRLYAAINYYTSSDQEFVDIYYEDRIEHYVIRMNKLFINKEPERHFFHAVPLIEYQNSDERLSDIEPVISLIDAHDAIVSNGISEDGKYADALLIMKNYLLDDEALARMRELRIIDNLESDAVVEYLTKPGAYEGRESLRKVIENLIYTMSGIPNLNEISSFSQQSGEALKYLYATFEVMVAGDKQSGFNAGLYKRLRLITNYINWKNSTNYESNGIKVNWKRNLPSESTVIIDDAIKLAGVISKRSILEMLERAGVILDVEAEMKRLDDEAGSNISGYINSAI